MERIPTYDCYNFDFSTSCTDIIDDITNDLASLSLQVSSVQHDFNHDDIGTSFESSLKALEEQNDKLQINLEHCLAEKNSLAIDYEKKISDLHCEIESLRGTLNHNNTLYQQALDKNACLQSKLDQLQSGCQCCATSSNESNQCQYQQAANQSSSSSTSTNVCKLQRQQQQQHICCEGKKNYEVAKNRCDILENEIYKCKSENNYLRSELEEKTNEVNKVNNQLMHREQVLREKLETVIEVRKCTEKGYQDTIAQQQSDICKMKKTEDRLLDDFEKLLNDFKEKSKEVELAKMHSSQLEKQLRIANRTASSREKEIELLKAEMFAVREKFACLEGVSSSVKSQLSATQDELNCYRKSYDLYLNLKNEFEELGVSYKRSKQSHLALIQKYNNMVEDYNKLETEYRKNLEIQMLLQSEIDSTRKWQQDQLAVEEVVEDKLKAMLERNNELLADRKNFENKVNEMYFENKLLAQELQNFKDLCGSLSSSNREFGGGDVVQHRNVDELVHKIMQKTLQMKQSREQFEDEEISARDNNN